MNRLRASRTQTKSPRRIGKAGTHAPLYRQRKSIRPPRGLGASRYPGSKWRLQKNIINPFIAQRYGCTPHALTIICDLYTGGGGSLMRMAQDFPNALFVVNDLNTDIALYWDFFRKHTAEELEWVKSQLAAMQPTVELHRRVFDWQPSIPCEAAFRVTFLRYTSYNGIIARCSPLGGKNQMTYKIASRYNLVKINANLDAMCALLSGRILSVHNCDALTLLTHLPNPVFVYCDPPYIKDGKGWYATSFTPRDFQCLRDSLGSRPYWCLSIDDCPAVRSVLALDDVRAVPIVYTASSAFNGGGKIPKSHEIVAFPQLPAGVRRKVHRPGHRIATTVSVLNTDATTIV